MPKLKSTRGAARAAFLSLLGTTILCGSGAAFAQDAAPPQEAAADDSAGDEIIVTAQKRSQSLQDVPISIQALTTKALDDKHVSNFNDFTKQLPSVSFQTSQPGSTNVYIRGVASGGDGNHSGSLPSVGVYLDEQPVTTIGGNLDVHIYDVARIEALAGPQGTLYGASSEAGTIRIITNKPDTSAFYGKIDVEGNTVRKGGQGGKAEGFINAPISDTIALRVVGFYEHDAGYIDNVPASFTFLGAPNGAGGYNPGITITNAATVKKDQNDVDLFGGRAALKIDFDDNWTATASVIGQDQKNHGYFGADPSLGDLKVAHYQSDTRHDRWLQGALTIEGKIGNWDVTYAGAYMKRKIDSENDYADYAQTYDSLYASVGGIANYFYYQDNAGNQVVPLQHVIGTDKFNKTSQELRISSPADSPFRVVGGVFYQRQHHNIRQDYQVAGLSPSLSVNGFAGSLWLTQQVRIDKDYAAFGEASWDITPNLTLNGGLRYYKYDNSLVGFAGFGRDPNGPPYNAAGSSRTGYAACITTDGGTVTRNPDGTPRTGPAGTLVAPVVGNSPCSNIGQPDGEGGVAPQRAKDDGFIHKVNLSWKIDRDHMIYATWSRGFRPGGANRFPGLGPYSPDFLTNYEIGWKTTWGDGTFRWNGAIFQQDWKKFQFSFLGQNSLTVIQNGPNARIRGVETDFTIAPVRGFNFTTSAAYIDGKTVGVLCTTNVTTCTGDDVVAAKGTPLPVTSKYKINQSARYEWETLGGKAHLQGVITFQSEASSQLVSNFNASSGPPQLDSYINTDLAAGIDLGNMSFEAYVDNVFDTRPQISTSTQCGACTTNYFFYLRPRTLGLRAGYKF